MYLRKLVACICERETDVDVADDVDISINDFDKAQLIRSMDTSTKSHKSLVIAMVVA